MGDLWWSKLASGELQEHPESVQKGPWSAQGCHLATFWHRLGTKMKPKLVQEGCQTRDPVLYDFLVIVGPALPSKIDLSPERGVKNHTGEFLWFGLSFESV